MNIIQDSGTIGICRQEAVFIIMLEPMFKVKEENAGENYAEFIIEPLEQGYGHTIGNALRRVLLASIAGAAVTSIKISGVKHKFATVPGLRENVVDLLLNIKGLHLRLLDGKNSGTIRLSVHGPKEIKAKDIEETEGVEVVNKDHYLGYLSDKKAKLDIEMEVERGYGYTLAGERKIGTLGVISTDAIFSPVVRVNYSIEATRVGRQTDLDKLILRVWTTGAITPKEALANAAKMLSSYFMQIIEPKISAQLKEGATAGSNISEEIMRLTLDELDLPTRIYNSLRNGGIETLGDLLAKPKRELMLFRNMGSKSIAIIEEKIREKGLSLSI